jgi:hypothetical protein
MTVGELLRRMSSIEIAEWIAEDRIRHREQEAADRSRLHPQHRQQERRLY